MHLATDAQPKTRIWATAQDRVQSIWSEATLSCSPHRRYADSWSGTASGSGVFLSEDNIRHAVSLAYTYAASDPITFTDPSGQQLYTPGPKPIEDPLYPLPSNCTATPWTFAGPVHTDRGVSTVWKKSGSKHLKAATTRGALSFGWCLCEYTMAGLVHKWRFQDLYERRVDCCTDGNNVSTVEFKTTNSFDFTTPEPSIYDPTIRMTRKAPATGFGAGDCACPAEIW